MGIVALCVQTVNGIEKPLEHHLVNRVFLPNDKLLVYIIPYEYIVEFNNRRKKKFTIESTTTNQLAHNLYKMVKSNGKCNEGIGVEFEQETATTRNVREKSKRNRNMYVVLYRK